MNPVAAIHGCFERWNIFASDQNDMSPVSPLVRSREWAKSEFNVGHSRVSVQTKLETPMGALARCDDGADLLASTLARCVREARAAKARCEVFGTTQEGYIVVPKAIAE